MKKPKYHNIRDAKGRFVTSKQKAANVKKEIENWEMVDTTSSKPHQAHEDFEKTYKAFDIKLAPDSPAKRNFLRVDSASTAHTGFGDEPTAPHCNKTKSALVWYSLGVLSGLIAWLAIEYYYHIFNPCR